LDDIEVRRQWSAMSTCSDVSGPEVRYRKLSRPISNCCTIADLER
jgi:hypothetical protein